MDTADVIVVGGGPAGSSCAWRLRQAGLDVVVVDRARFPRDKVCAGWITPAVVEQLELDLGDYAVGRTLQPFTGFGTALIGGEPRLTAFHEPVSYGIRRCEFDAYLLDRSRARLLTGVAVTTVGRKDDGWIVGDRVRAPMLVGAGGHFCPVARWLNPERRNETVVVAQEAEFRLRPKWAADHPVRPDAPELYFWPDLCGYGWCVRKGAYLNVGVGKLRPAAFPAAVRDFQKSLEARGVLPPDAPRTWKGHAYLLNRTSGRRLHGDGVLLVGDAAGLALAPSGEGILPAVESGLIAADVILGAHPARRRADLEPYAQSIASRFGWRVDRSTNGPAVPAWIATATGRMVLASPWLTRRLLIEKAFLHRDRPAA